MNIKDIKIACRVHGKRLWLAGIDRRPTESEYVIAATEYEIFFFTSLETRKFKNTS